MPKPGTRGDLGAFILSGKYTIRVIKALLEAPGTCTGIAERAGIDGHAAVRYTLRKLERYGLVESKIAFRKNSRMAVVERYSIAKPAFKRALLNIEQTIKNLRGSE